MKKKIDKSIVIVALLCLTALEICAMLNGINGIMLRIIIIVIAGLAGFVLPSPVETK